jgi:hypothetical protein
MEAESPEGNEEASGRGAGATRGQYFFNICDEGAYPSWGG